MYIIFALVVIIYLLLFLLGRRKGFEPKRKGIPGVFDIMASEALMLWGQMSAALGKSRTGSRGRDSPVKGKSADTAVITGLVALSPGEKPEALYRDFIRTKLSMCLMVFFIGTAAAFFSKLSAESERSVFSGKEIERSIPSGETKTYSLETSFDGFETPIEISVSPRKMSDDELEEVLPEFYEKLEKALIGENESPKRIEKSLALIREVEGYPFSVEWSSSDTSLVEAGTGKVSEVFEDANVIMTATIKYGEKTFEKQYILTVICPELSEGERLYRNLEALLKESEAATREDEVWTLPENFEGEKLVWRASVKDYSIYIFLGVLVITVLIFKMSDKDLGDKVNEKRKKMKMAYPEVLQKMILYIGAGMTVRSAFGKVAVSGMENGNPIYSEMLFACREIKSGRSEEDVYISFGRRCGVQEYIRLSTLLGQNLKRGSSNLIERLREEAENAFDERLQNCRKSGEEAVTKLLLPMVMMLLVVMVMILLPAFSNMNL